MTSNANITIEAGTHTISVPLVFSGSLTVSPEDTTCGIGLLGPISGTGMLFATGPGLLTLGSTNNTYVGNTIITGGTLSAAGPGSLGTSGTVSVSSATLDFTGSGTLGRALVLGDTGAIIQADSGVLSLGLVSGTGGLTKAGLGTLALSESYAGSASVLAGTLRLSAANVLADNATVALAPGAALDLYGNGQALSSIAGDGTVTNGKAGSKATLTAAYNGGLAEYDAAIQDGAGSIGLAVPAGGQLTLTNTNNTFSLGTSVSGALTITADGELGAPTSGVSLSGGTLFAANSLSLARSRGISLCGNSSLNVAGGYSMTIAGSIGGGTLTKDGNGTLSLGNLANSYTGGTIINNGTLVAACDGSLVPAEAAWPLTPGRSRSAAEVPAATSISAAAAIWTSPRAPSPRPACSAATPASPCMGRAHCS